MRYCTECGEKLQDDQSFCPNCGAKIIRPDESEQNRQPVADNGEYAQPAVNPSPAPKKNNKKIWIVICAAVVALALVAVILLLTIPRCTGTGRGAVEEILPPSKEKIVTLESRSLDQVWNTAFNNADSMKDSSFDADISLDLQMDSSESQSAPVSAIVRSVALSLKKDRNNFAANLSLFGNTYLDLRLFDLDKDTIYLYCAPGSDKLYQIRLQTIVDLLSDSVVDSDVPLDEIKDLLLSDKSAGLLQKDYEAIRDAFLELIGNAEVNAEATVELFGNSVPCELYTIRPTAEQFETALNRLLTYALNGDGLIPKFIRTNREFLERVEDLREEIPDAARYLEEHNVGLEVAVSGNTILSQKGYFDQYCVGYDSYTDSVGQRTQIYYIPNTNSMNNRIVFLNMTEASDGNVTFDASVDLPRIGEISIFGSFNKNQKSVIGTYAGELTVQYNEKNVAKVTITQNGSSMIHSIDLNKDLFRGSGITQFIVIIETKPGSGVARPSGAETVDTSNFTSSDWQNLLRQFLAPFQMLAGSAF